MSSVDGSRDRVAATLHHTHLMASDIDATIAFWVECFGGRVVADTGMAGARNVLLEVGGGRLNLYDQPPNHRGVVNHLGVQVADVAATVAALTEAGWEPRPIKEDDSLTYAMVQGPDALLLEVFRFDPDTIEPGLRPYFDIPEQPPVQDWQSADADRPVYGAGDLSPEAEARLAGQAPEPLVMPDRGDYAAVQRWRTAINGSWLDGDPAPEALGHHSADVGGIRCLAVNADQPGGTVVYVHGGGFCLGSPEVSVPITSGIAGPRQVDDGVRLLSVDYRLAPEHPYPAAFDDVLAVVRAVAAERPGQPILLAGDSAGANIALAVSMVVTDEVSLAGVVLLSPFLDLQSDNERIDLDPRSDVDRSGSTWFSGAYRGAIEPGNPVVSPVRGNLTGLPPLLVQAGTRDNTMPDAVQLARRARSAGVSVTLDLWDGLWHTWHYHRELPEASSALAEVRRFIKSRFDASATH